MLIVISLVRIRDLTKLIKFLSYVALSYVVLSCVALTYIALNILLDLILINITSCLDIIICSSYLRILIILWKWHEIIYYKILEFKNCINFFLHVLKI